MAENEEIGQGMVEYGLIIALIAVGVIAALVILGPKVAGIFTGISGSMLLSFFPGGKYTVSAQCVMKLA